MCVTKISTYGGSLRSEFQLLDGGTNSKRELSLPGPVPIPIETPHFVYHDSKNRSIDDCILFPWFNI